MNKPKIIKRIVLAAVIVASGVFASFYGGAARSVFYASLMLPAVSLLYTLYVYTRFRIYQSVEFKTVVKGEKTPYFFILSDEDFISYSDVRVTFLEDFSAPQNMSICRSYFLTPGEKIERHTEILCKYRGEYRIGVKDVIITDFLGIFDIKYPAPSVINMSVLPKLTKLEKLTLSPVDSDAKLVRFSRQNSPQPPDCEMRKFASGDRIKLINWRVSAKSGELMVRKSSEVQNNGVTFIMDLTENKCDDYKRIITEDKIIESALAVTDYLVGKNVPVTLMYECVGMKRIRLSNRESFMEFYSGCAALNFTGKHSPADIGRSVLSSLSEGFVIFAVHSLSEELCALCNTAVELGKDAAIILIGEEDKLCDLLDTRVIFKRISINDEISDALGGSHEH